jgi:nitrite reductase/ring-hydroxylating ferredoxin subunit
MDHHGTPRAGLSRRALFGGAMCAGLALAGCTPPPSGTSGTSGTTSTTDTPGSPGPPGTTVDGPPGALAALADLPVGGGVVAPGPVLVIRLDEERVAAYSAICPHQALVVPLPDATGTITCPGHGARFRAADGTLLSGPAPGGLRTVAVRVRDGFVVRE